MQNNNIGLAILISNHSVNKSNKPVISWKLSDELPTQSFHSMGSIPTPDPEACVKGMKNSILTPKSRIKSHSPGHLRSLIKEYLHSNFFY